MARFAIEQKMKRQKPDYWDEITLVELAVLENNFDLAGDRLGDAISKISAGWMAETTINNLRMLQSHIGDRMDGERLEDVIGELEKYRK